MFEKSQFYDPCYEADLERMSTSGAHRISHNMRSINRRLHDALERAGLWPLYDTQKRSDCDLLYRFLFVNVWNVPACVTAIGDYLQWRRQHAVDTILQEPIEEELGDVPRFMGRDREGYPVMYNILDPEALTTLIRQRPRAELLRRHVTSMERGRYLCNRYDTDRITCVLDLSKVTMRNINSETLGLLKEVTQLDQRFYPELLRRVIVCNGGWAVTAAWLFVHPFLEQRVQMKFSFVSGPPDVRTLRPFIDPSQIPRSFGGVTDDCHLREDFSSLLRPRSHA